jgi:hypothetical protein
VNAADSLSRDIVDVLGYRASIGASSEPVRGSLRSIFQGFSSSNGSVIDALPRFDLIEPVPGTWQVLADGERVHEGDALPAAMGLLEWRVVTAALRARNDLFHLHGASLCLPTERSGIVLVGGSSRGKTTLAMGLILRGFVPFADDVTLMEPQSLQLRAFKRAFHVDESTWPLLQPLGGPATAPRESPAGYFSPPQWAEQSVPVRWVLLPEYRPQQKPELIPLTPTELAGALVQQTISFGGSSRMALSTAARITARVRGYRFLTGDLLTTVGVVQRLVSSSPA